MQKRKSMSFELNKDNLQKMYKLFEKYPPVKDIPIRIDVCSVVNDPEKMVKVSLATCKTYYSSDKGNYRVQPYWNRLIIVAKATKEYYKNNENG